MMGVYIICQTRNKLSQKSREAVNGPQWEYRETSQRAKICRKKKTKQKKKMAIMQPKDSYDQQQWYHNEVDHGQTGCS